MNLPKTLEELHHAYVASADVATLVAALAERGVPRTGCPDVYIYECQQFGIDDARSLRERASMNPITLSRRIFIVACASVNAEAQNALLKTLEEPRGNAVFFFLLPSPERLLPTFRSRTQQLHVGHPISCKSPSAHEQFTKSLIPVDTFLRAKPAERITLLEVFTKKKEDEERDMQGIHALLDELERTLPRERVEGLRAVYRAKRYMADKGALVKPLLEQIALLL